MLAVPDGDVRVVREDVKLLAHRILAVRVHLVVDPAVRVLLPEVPEEAGRDQRVAERSLRLENEERLRVLPLKDKGVAPPPVVPDLQQADELLVHRPAVDVVDERPVLVIGEFGLHRQRAVALGVRREHLQHIPVFVALEEQGDAVLVMLHVPEKADVPEHVIQQRLHPFSAPEHHEAGVKPMGVREDRPQLREYVELQLAFDLPAEAAEVADVRLAGLPQVGLDDLRDVDGEDGVPDDP